ncbi:MAG TPA: hypothetical protein VIM36_02020, partial [Gemmatimonadaceae bacterium]
HKINPHECLRGKNQASYNDRILFALSSRVNDIRFAASAHRLPVRREFAMTRKPLVAPRGALR